MSFIQKLIERKTQATGSMASEHAVDEDLATQEADIDNHEDEITMVDIIDLDDPEDDLSEEPTAAVPEPSDNILHLDDPFILDEEDEISADISDLPDLDAEIDNVADISGAAAQDDAADLDEDDDIDAGDEAFNIWDIDMDDGSDEPEAEAVTEPSAPQAAPQATPQQNQAANTRMPQVRGIEPVNEEIIPQMPEPAPEITRIRPEEEPQVLTPAAIAPAPEAPVPEAPVHKAFVPEATVSEASPEVSVPEASVPKAQIVAAPQAPEKRRIGRVKTRLLGFEHASKPGIDLFDPSTATEKVAQPRFPVGWLVVVDGPGHGESFALQAGMSQIGRGEDQAVSLDFGDATISRNNHAAIVYDVETHTFLMGHGGKANVVRHNGKPLICTEEVKNTDLIRIGETTLRLVVLCTAEFNWEEQD